MPECDGLSWLEINILVTKFGPPKQKILAPPLNAEERQDEEFDPTEETHLLSSTKKKPEELKKGLSLFFILFSSSFSSNNPSPMVTHIYAPEVSPIISFERVFLLDFSIIAVNEENLRSWNSNFLFNHQRLYQLN